MTENLWLAIVTIAACLVLALSGYASRGITIRKSMLHVVIWGVIFIVVAIGFSIYAEA